MSVKADYSELSAKSRASAKPMSAGESRQIYKARTPTGDALSAQKPTFRGSFSKFFQAFIWILLGRLQQYQWVAEQKIEIGPIVCRLQLRRVLPGLVPGIHAEPPPPTFQRCPQPRRVGGRDKPGQDAEGCCNAIVLPAGDQTPA
jgi:hypothetical protein